MQLLNGWENFHIIVGSSAGALIGLQFVVMTLINELPMTSTEAQAGEAFGSPNIVHFSVVLLVSALVSVPWENITLFQGTMIVVGVSGVAYTLYILSRVMGQSVYKPVLEDWLFYIILPVAVYSALICSVLLVDTKTGLFIIGIASLL